MRDVIDLKNYVYFSKILIETGTSSGGGVQRALNAGYDDIRSVELMTNFYDYSFNLFKENPKVKLYLGKSTDHLSDMIPTEDRCVIILDAHPSGPNTGGHDDLMLNGSLSEFDQNNILTKEVEIITHKSGGRDLIIIDDQGGINPLITRILPKTYRYELVNDNRYMVCIPDEDRLV